MKGHVYGIWFLPHRDGTVDWMGTLFKHGGRWIFEYRFRYYNKESRSPFDGRDEKKWYTWVSKTDSDADRDKILEAIRIILAGFEPDFGENADFVHLDCPANDPKVMFELGSRPWAHVKMLSEEEARDYEKDTPQDQGETDR